MDSYFIEHMKDLSEKSEARCIYTFSNFLTAEEINELNMNRRQLTSFSLFGGAEGCERLMARFGSEEELYYTEDFPVVCLKIEPLNRKFSDILTHRDYLGAVMNLSIEREHIGDIVVKDDCAYMFVTKKMSAFICENLSKIKHTTVKCSECEFSGDDSMFTLEDADIIASSLRADCVICAVFRLSRSAAEQLFSAKKVFINSVSVESSSRLLKPDDTVSVRGFGKFIFRNEFSSTKKGRLKIRVSIYK